MLVIPAAWTQPAGVWWRPLDHLQMGIKQAQSEIDALFLALEGTVLQHEKNEIIVTCEAKGRVDDILPGQIMR